MTVVLNIENRSMTNYCTSGNFMFCLNSDYLFMSLNTSENGEWKFYVELRRFKSPVGHSALKLCFTCENDRETLVPVKMSSSRAL